MKSAYRIWIRKPGGKKHSEDLGINGSIILKFMLKK
jgi:hypothetical protein